MLTRGPFWPLRRVDASFLHLEYSLFVVYTLHLLECNKKKTCCRGPPHSFSSKIVCYLLVTYLLPTNYFLLLLKATKKPFNRAFCFKHSTFKLTFRELWSTTSCFKTVFFTFFSTRVTSNESCSF